MTGLLEGKVAVIYGAEARAFAQAGARVFLASSHAGAMTGTVANLSYGAVTA